MSMRRQNVKNAEIPFVTLFGIRVSAVSKEQCLAWIERWIQRNEKKVVVTPNPEQIVLSQKDRSFRKILNSADLALADGVGLLWASRILAELSSPSRRYVEGSTLRERVTGEEVMQELVGLAAEKGWKVFLLGGRPGVAREAAEKLKIKNEKIKIKTSYGARQVREETKEERKRIIKEVNSFKPHLLFVAYGAPWQEKWLAKHFDKLNINVAMVVGGAFDMIVDPTLRPPRLMSQFDLDWLYRLVRQPWRIRRQLALVKFVVLVLTSGIRRK